jgi:hypothetical protein
MLTDRQFVEFLNALSFGRGGRHAPYTCSHQDPGFYFRKNPLQCFENPTN